METTIFLKPKFCIAALPGTGLLQVQVEADAEKPAVRQREVLVVRAANTN